MYRTAAAHVYKAERFNKGLRRSVVSLTGRQAGLPLHRSEDTAGSKEHHFTCTTGGEAEMDALSIIQQRGETCMCYLHPDSLLDKVLRKFHVWRTRSEELHCSEKWRERGISRGPAGTGAQPTSNNISTEIQSLFQIHFPELLDQQPGRTMESLSLWHNNE